MKKDNPTSAEQDRVPILTGSYRGYNIVRMNNIFYGVPQNLGPMDLQTVEINTIQEIVSGSTLEIAGVNINKALEEKTYKNLIRKVTEKSYVKFGHPELIEIELTHNCNLRCVMCHVSHGDFSDRILDPIFIEHLKGIEGKWVLLGSGFEPLLHPKSSEILLALSNLQMKIDLITNGTLLTKSISDRIADLNFVNITISFDGIRKETYESIRRNANYDRTIERIAYFKERVKTKQAYFTINNTLMKRNINEIVESVEFWERYGFDHMGFILMVIRDPSESLGQEHLEVTNEYLQKNLFDAAKLIIEKNYKLSLSSPAFNYIPNLKEAYPINFIDSCVKSNNHASQLPFNPRTFFQLGKYPGMHVPCKSPFTCVQILFDGDVFLCQTFKIGNIYEKQLLDIWYGESAQKIRRAILNNPQLCYGCDYYRYCIKGGEIDYNVEKNYYSNNIVYKGRNPVLVENFGRYNIVGWLERYYGIPKALGPLDLTVTNVNNIEGVFIDDDIFKLKEKISTYSASNKGIRSKWNFFINRLLNTTKYSNNINATYGVPVLVEDFGMYNIVDWLERYYGIPKALGPLDLTVTNVNNIEGVFIDDNISKLKEKISTYSASKKGIRYKWNFFILTLINKLINKIIHLD